MEARQTLRGSAVPRNLLVVLGMSVAIALAVGAAAIARDMAGSSAPTLGTFHPAAGTVLRQDNPVQGAGLVDRAAQPVQNDLTRALPVQKTGSPAGIHVGRSSGTQSVEGAAPAAASSQPSKNFDEKPGFRD